MKFKKIVFLIIALSMLSSPVLVNATEVNGQIIIGPEQAEYMELLDLSRYVVSSDERGFILTPKTTENNVVVEDENNVIPVEEDYTQPEEDITEPPNPVDDKPVNPATPTPTQPVNPPDATASNDYQQGPIYSIIPEEIEEETEEDYDVYGPNNYDSSDFDFGYNPYANDSFDFTGDYGDWNYFEEVEQIESEPGDNFLKTDTTMQYLLQSEQKYPKYKDTGIRPVDGFIDYDELQNITRDIAIEKKAKMAEDIDRVMILIDGKLIILGEAETEVSKLEDKFKDTSVKVAAQDTRAGGKFNVVDYMEVMQELTININEKETIMITDPVIDNSRALMPIRSIADGLGATTTWNEKTRVATVTKGEKNIEFKADSDIVRVNGKEYLITHKTLIKNEDMRMLSVIRLLVIELGATMEWDAVNLELNINNVKPE